MNIGIIGGVALNLLIKYNFDNIFWIWFNLTGFVATMLLAIVFSEVFKTSKTKVNTNINFKLKRSDFLSKEVLILVLFFIAIIVFSLELPNILGNI